VLRVVAVVYFLVNRDLTSLHMALASQKQKCCELTRSTYMNAILLVDCTSCQPSRRYLVIPLRNMLGYRVILCYITWMTVYIMKPKAQYFINSVSYLLIFFSQSKAFNRVYQ